MDMGKANIYLILVVIIVPIFLQLIQGKIMKNSTTTVTSDTNQTNHTLEQKSPVKLKVNDRIVPIKNFLENKMTSYQDLFFKSIVAGGSKQNNNKIIQNLFK